VTFNRSPCFFCGICSWGGRGVSGGSWKKTSGARVARRGSCQVRPHHIGGGDRSRATNDGCRFAARISATQFPDGIGDVVGPQSGQARLSSAGAARPRIGNADRFSRPTWFRPPPEHFQGFFLAASGPKPVAPTFLRNQEVVIAAAWAGGPGGDYGPTKGPGRSKGGG